MIHRRPGDERFFEIYQACVDKNPNNNMHFFGHGANNIDNIDRDLMDLAKQYDIDIHFMAPTNEYQDPYTT